ncbi:M28 family peptidase, partial [bacterium]|nr:M28 family peptidase [bacterium]
MKPLYKYITAACLFSLTGLSMPGCHNRAADSVPETNSVPPRASATPEPQKTERLKTASAFDADRAWQDLASQVNIGPRYVGSTGSAQTRTWLTDSLKIIGYKVFEQKFTADTPDGKKEFVNIIACLEKDENRFPAPPEPPENSDAYYYEEQKDTAKPAPRSAIVLAAHYDTKRFPKFSFVGANDGASGVAALLELARVFKAESLTKHRLIFCFLDGEEAIKEWTYEDSLYGSNYFTNSLSSKKCPLDLGAEDIVAAIVLDMVADKDLHITYETVSHPQLM